MVDVRRAGNSTIDPGVFGISVVITVLFVLWGVLASDNLAAVTGAVLDFVIANFGWVFGLMSVIAIVLVALFFVSGADAASVVMGMLSSKGNINPARPIVIVWGTLTGAAAAIALLADGLNGLQTAAILSAAPFVLIMIGLCLSIFKALRAERLPREAPEPERAVTRPTGAPAPQQARAVDPESRS